MTDYVKSLSISDVSRNFRENLIDPVNFIDELCDYIEEKEPFIQSFVPEVGRKKRLLKETELLLKKFSNSYNRPPLFCVPIGIKDIFIADNFETRAGSSLPPELFRGKESSFVTKLKNAGALIVGKTVTTEFAYFEPGPATNPHNILHTPGGSSSGSAAAVSAGFCALASGTQTIGSISRPASYCGIFGYKPSFARIPVDGIIPFAPSLDHAGFFTNNLPDINLVASLLCLDWNKNIAKSQQKHLPVIGIISNLDYLLQANKEVNDFYNEFLIVLKNKNFKIVEIDPFENIESINKLHHRLAAAEMSKVHKEWFSKYYNLYRKRTVELIKEGMTVTADEIAKALEGRILLKNKIESLMQINDIDIIITPATVDAAPESLSSTGSPLMNLPWTYSGLPTLSIPAGKNSEKLPLGIQIIGKFYRDEEMLLNAEMLEQICYDLFHK